MLGIKKHRRSLSFTLGITISAVVVAFFIMSYVYLPKDPTAMELTMKFLRPGEAAGYPLGTDNFGRDILSRTIYGTRNVLAVGVVSVLAGAIAGTALGAVAGMVKGFIGAVIMRFIDGLMAFPGILLAMMLVAVVGKGNRGTIIAVAIFMVPIFARLVNSLILDNENHLFIKAAKSHGVTGLRLLPKHYLPLMLPRLITQFTGSIGSAIMIETSLSFLGLGVQPPNASWGLMLSDAKQFFLLYPYLAVAPGIATALTVLGFNLLGDGLNDLLITRRPKR